MLSQDSASSSRPSVGMELASSRRSHTLPSHMVDLAAHLQWLLLLCISVILAHITSRDCVINIFVHVGPEQYVSGSSLTFFDAQVTLVY